MQADGFYIAYNILSSEELMEQQEIMSSVGQSVIVLTAFCIQLFLKCLVCIETGKVPRGQHLKHLHDQPSIPTRKKIEFYWDTEAVPHHDSMWKKIEGNMGITSPRD